MRWGLALSWTLAACSFEGPPALAPDGSATPDAPTICATYSSQFDTCDLTQPLQLDLSGELKFDTDTGALTSNGADVSVVSRTLQTADGPVRVLLATTVIFQNDAHLRAAGSAGFSIAATGSITLKQGALINVADGGAGFRTTCPDGPKRGENDSGGAAGGGGAGYGAAGGRGGNGNQDGGQSQGGDPGKAAAARPTGVLGGCTGAAGGNQGGSNLGGAGGFGGGAVYLVARESIAIAAGAGINAGGGAGGGGTRSSGFGDAGGGGGGSGGMIFLEAPTIQSQGTLAANGGGGGQASGNNAAGMPGQPGQLGTDPAAGGTGGSSSGTDGGPGGCLATPAGGSPSGVDNGGGGGGGGGVGIIRVVAPTQNLGALVSPMPS